MFAVAQDCNKQLLSVHLLFIFFFSSSFLLIKCTECTMLSLLLQQSKLSDVEVGDWMCRGKNTQVQITNNSFIQLS